ncbi:MAG: M23 family metallopeptidase [Candidatus Colwellbacteria bacterium]|nr:M23 family metallopeptidase [Candidatus Colwellbacteria bacterium]
MPPIFLALGLFGANFFYLSQASTAKPPEATSTADGPLEPAAAALISDVSPLGELVMDDPEDEFLGFVLVDKASLLNSASPASNVSQLRGGLLTYEVEEGDSVSTIAANFGISVNTIIWANDLKGSGLIRPDQEIVILPVSGVLHRVKSGETLESIAKVYDVSEDEIARLNKGALKAGESVIVPGGKPTSASGRGAIGGSVESRGGSSRSNLPELSGYFGRPVNGGWNWGELHDGNAVDISSACGSPVYAAAAGTVSLVSGPLSWSGGYGGLVRINHSNGTKTLYAHTSENLVTNGQEVAQGEAIARVGRTGKVSGRTGCHVHFGVTGAANPFAR